MAKNLIILAGGNGTRAKEYTDTIKPLIPINGTPIIRRVIDSFYYETGVEYIYIVTRPEHTVEIMDSLCGKYWHVDRNDICSASGTMRCLDSYICIYAFEQKIGYGSAAAINAIWPYINNLHYPYYFIANCDTYITTKLSNAIHLLSRAYDYEAHITCSLWKFQAETIQLDSGKQYTIFDDVKEDVSTGIYYLGRERILRISEYFLKKYEEDPNCDYRIQCCPELSDDALDKIHVSGNSVFFDIGTKQGYDELIQYIGEKK